MKTVQTIAVVTSDGKLTMDAPKGLKRGPHRVTLSVEEELTKSVSRTFKGRRIYTQEETEKMHCPFPPEPE
jgi:hypothetical protein